MMGNWASVTYWASESSVSDTAGTTLRVGKMAGRTTVRPLWITSITYLRNNSYIRKHHPHPASTTCMQGCKGMIKADLTTVHMALHNKSWCFATSLYLQYNSQHPKEGTHPKEEKEKTTNMLEGGKAGIVF